MPESAREIIRHLWYDVPVWAENGMNGKAPLSRLVETIRESNEDPLSAGRLERLWGADYQLSDPVRIDTALDDVLGAIAGQVAQGAAATDLARILETFRHAALIVRRDGRIEAMNLRARRTISADPGDKVDRIGFELLPARPLSAAIDAFLNAKRPDQHASRLWQAVGENGRSAMLAVVPHGAGRARAMLFVIDPVWVGKAGATARELYGLTEAEAEILAAFLNGSSLQHIARDRSTSYSTVRTQLHSVMTKFGVTSQAALVRVAFGLSQFLADVAPIAEIARHPHRRRYKLLAAGGRSIEVFLAGDPQGKPVVFLPDCTLYVFAAQIEAAFHAAGLCVLSIGRPGFGGTDPAPEGVDDQACVCADVATVLDQIGARQAVVASHGVSAPYAYALAAAMPERVLRVVVISGTTPRPYLDTDFIRAPFAGALVRARDVSPRLFRIIVKTSSNAWKRLGTRRFNSMNLVQSPADSALALTEDCLEEFDAALGAQLVRGSWRLEDDLMLGTADWSRVARCCTAPIVLLHGQEDPVTAIAQVERFAGTLPAAELRGVQGAGYLVHCAASSAMIRAFSLG